MGKLEKVQEIGLSTQEEKSSQITLTSELIERAIQPLELYPHVIRMVALKGISILSQLQVLSSAPVTDLKKAIIVWL